MVRIPAICPSAVDPDASDEAPSTLTLMWPGEVTLDDIVRAAADSRPGSASWPSQLPADLAEELPPGAELAQWLAASPPAQLDDFRLSGVAAGWHRLAAWAQACEFAAVAEMAARAAARDSSVRIGPDGSPASVPSEASDEVALALRMSRLGGAWWVDLAVSLSWRLPATLDALRAGEIDFPRARLIVEATGVLDPDGARAVQDKVLPAARRQTLGQLRASLRRAVISVDPSAAERRRAEAERKAKVGLYSDEEGTATLAGHNLPGAQSTAAMARITAIAQAMKGAGAGGGIDLLRAKAYLGLLLGTLPLIPPSDGGPEPPESEPGDVGPGDDPGDAGPGDADLGDSGPHGARGSLGSTQATGDQERGPRWNVGWPGLPRPGEPPAPGCAPDWPAGLPPPGRTSLTGRVRLTVSWPTLAGLSGEPGEVCWLGPVTPTTARVLAAAAAAEASCRWQVVVAGPSGEAVAVTRFSLPGRGRRRCEPRPTASGSSAIPTSDPPASDPPMNAPPLSVPVGAPQTNPPRAGAPPGGTATGMIGQVTLVVPAHLASWAEHAGRVRRRSEDNWDPLAEVLLAALAAGRKALAERAAEASAATCDHRSSSSAYRPSGRLRDFIVGRDQTCRFPGCRQPAWRTDLDHTVAFDKGGRTCRCNLGPLCRAHHQLKQRPRWRLVQPTPGTFMWTTPAGREHTVTPPRLCEPQPGPLPP